MRFDESLEFKQHPYRFIAKRCRQIASDVSVTRLFLRKTSGRTEQAARRQRQAMFLVLTTPGRIRELADLFRQELLAELPHWQEQDPVVLYETLQRVLTRAVCKWSGVPLAPREAARRSKQLAALFDAADRSPAHFKSRLARIRAEDWAAGLIENVRLGAIRPPHRTALREIALHRDIDGQLLSAQVAVELLTVLNPTVAASGYIVNCARALHQFPLAAEELKTGGQPYRDTFISPVQKSYPTLPAIPDEIAVPLMRTAIGFFTATIRYNAPAPELRA